MDEYLKANRLDVRRFNYEDEQWQKIVENMAKGPQDPRLAVAQMRAQLDERLTPRGRPPSRRRNRRGGLEPGTHTRPDTRMDMEPKQGDTVTLPEGELAQANLIIVRSPNGRDGWEPVPPAEVPTWVKSPDNIAHLVAGEMCMKRDENDRTDKGSDWYRAISVDDAIAVNKALAKRKRREQRRLARMKPASKALN
jgi:hypothetical protein